MLLGVTTMKTTVKLRYTDVHRSKPTRISLQHGLLQKVKWSFRVSIGPSRRLGPLSGMAFLLNCACVGYKLSHCLNCFPSGSSRVDQINSDCLAAQISTALIKIVKRHDCLTVDIGYIIHVHYAVASCNGSQGMPGNPPKNRILTGLSNTFGKVLKF